MPRKPSVRHSSVAEREFHRTVWEPVAGGVHHRWDATVDGGVTWNVLHEAWLRPTNKVLQK